MKDSDRSKVCLFVLRVPGSRLEYLSIVHTHTIPVYTARKTPLISGYSIFITIDIQMKVSIY